MGGPWIPAGAETTAEVACRGIKEPDCRFLQLQWMLLYVKHHLKIVNNN
jgi:hypothetical protein